MRFNVWFIKWYNMLTHSFALPLFLSQFLQLLQLLTPTSCRTQCLRRCAFSELATCELWRVTALILPTHSTLNARRHAALSASKESLPRWNRFQYFSECIILYSVPVSLHDRREWHTHASWICIIGLASVGRWLLTWAGVSGTGERWAPFIIFEARGVGTGAYCSAIYYFCGPLPIGHLSRGDYYCFIQLFLYMWRQKTIS